MKKVKQKQKKKNQTKEEKKQRKKAEGMYADEIMPIINFNEELEAAIMEDASFLDMVQVRCSDKNTAAQEDIDLENLCWEKLYKVHSDNLKILSFNFATDTSAQLAYFARVLERTKHPAFRTALSGEIKVLENIRKEKTDREHCLVFYAEDEEKLRDVEITVWQTLTRGRESFITRPSAEKKRNIFFKQFNPNTAI